MSYIHGSFAELDKSLAKSAIQGSTTIVAVGTLPIDNVEDWKSKDLINKPIVINSLKQAKEKLGYSEDADWSKFTLCEVIDFFFNNSLQPAAPLILINVYNPLGEGISTGCAQTDMGILIQQPAVFLIAIGGTVLGLHICIAIAVSGNVGI